MPDNHYPAWKQQRCRWCAEGLPKESAGTHVRIVIQELPLLLGGETRKPQLVSEVGVVISNEYPLCTAPDETAYIKQLERALRPFVVLLEGLRDDTPDTSQILGTEQPPEKILP